MTPRLLEAAADRFRVLGDPTRLEILNTLLEHEELNVGEIVEALGSSQANVSKHLRILFDAGIVARRQAGTAAYYSIIDPTITSLCDIVCERIRAQAQSDAEALMAT